MLALPPFIHADYPLGLDRVSRDLLSRLLWAVRPTLVLCLLAATIRVVIGLGLGIMLGIWGKRAQWLLDWLVMLSGAIPLLLVAIAVILFRPDQAGLGTFLIALNLTGWISTAVLVQARVQMISQAAYVESARAIGLTQMRIVLRHVLPQIWPLVPMLLASELAAVTLLVAELGYLGLYIGGAFVYADFASDSPVPDYLIPTSSRPELGQMVSDFFSQVNRTPWEPMFAGCAIVLMLVGWTLVSEGLRRRLDVTRPKSQKIRWLSFRRKLHPPHP
jgi:ABC-type dipeptide/oligopeptide/nickel transport system permease subunit